MVRSKNINICWAAPATPLKGERRGRGEYWSLLLVCVGGGEGDWAGRGTERGGRRKPSRIHHMPYRRMAVRLNGRGDGTGSSPRVVSVQCGQAGGWGRGGVRATGQEGEGEGEGEENLHASTTCLMAVRLNGKGDGTGSSSRAC